MISPSSLVSRFNPFCSLRVIFAAPLPTEWTSQKSPFWVFTIAKRVWKHNVNRAAIFFLLIDGINLVYTTEFYLIITCNNFFQAARWTQTTTEQFTQETDSPWIPALVIITAALHKKRLPLPRPVIQRQPYFNESFRKSICQFTKGDLTFAKTSGTVTAWKTEQRPRSWPEVKHYKNRRLWLIT